MLSDPDLCQVENQRDSTQAMEGSVSASASPSECVDGSAVSIPETPKPLTKLERLQQRMPFRIDQAAIAARREKAQEIFRAAELSMNAGRLSEAEASIRIAISFDPGRSEFKEALGTIRIQAAGARATKLLASPSERMIISRRLAQSQMAAPTHRFASKGSFRPRSRTSSIPTIKPHCRTSPR